MSAVACDVVVADIGSTLTKVSALAGVRERSASAARLLAQVTTPTTTDEGDVGLGLERAFAMLALRHGVDAAAAPLWASASAAGGLRMSVHGLTRDMTLAAGREASTGAGARVVLATAGAIAATDLDRIAAERPNVVLLVGGVDDGEREQVLANARALASLAELGPVVFAGNQAIRDEVESVLRGAGHRVSCAANVYPALDRLTVEPARRVIQEVFARHVVVAPGMERVVARLAGAPLPTPAAVLRATELAAEELGDVVVVDVGGATTDVCSVVSEPSHRSALRLGPPEPRAKRTVEGDLGVFRSAASLVAAGGEEAATVDLAALAPLPETDAARALAARLARIAVDVAVWRHAGERREEWGAQGAIEVIDGRDLSAVASLIGTGGALTRIAGGAEILGQLRRDPRGRKLLPPAAARVRIDRDYVMAVAGVLAERFPDAARALLRASLGIEAGARGEDGRG